MKALTDTELEAIKAKLIEISDEPVMELDLSADALDLDLDLDVTAIPAADPTQGSTSAPTPAPAGPSRRSTKISIRISERTLTAFKAQAAKNKIPYQRLVNQVLRAAAAGWAPL